MRAAPLLTALAIVASGCSNDAAEPAAAGPSPTLTIDHTTDEADEPDPSELLSGYGTLLVQAAASGGDALERTLTTTAAEPFDPDDCTPAWAHELLAAENLSVDVVDDSTITIGPIVVEVTMLGDHVRHLGGDCTSALPKPDRPAPTQARSKTTTAPSSSNNNRSSTGSGPGTGSGGGTVSGGGSGASTVSISGTVTVLDTMRSREYANDDCWASGGFSDIGPGTQVRIEDGNGQLLGLGRLGSPYEKSSGANADYVTCHWDFAPISVPAAAFYTVTVSHRGGPTMTQQELASQNWSVFLYL